MIPLQQYICDSCGGLIEKPEDGWVEWLTLDHDKMGYINHGFRIVHWDSSEVGTRSCAKYNDNIHASHSHLHHFIDDRYKLGQLYSMIDMGPIRQPEFLGAQVDNLREYVEFIRRLTIPHYEEARQYWNDAKQDGYFSDLNEIDIYAVHHLQTLIERYSQ